MICRRTAAVQLRTVAPAWREILQDQDQRLIAGVERPVIAVQNQAEGAPVGQGKIGAPAVIGHIDIQQRRQIGRLARCRPADLAAVQPRQMQRRPVVAGALLHQRVILEAELAGAKPVHAFAHLQAVIHIALRVRRRRHAAATQGAAAGTDRHRA